MKKYDFSEKPAFKTPSGVRAEIVGIEHYHMHLHRTCTEIICVLRGHVTAYDFAIPYTLGPGEIHVFNNNDPHKIDSDDPDSVVLLVHIDKDHYSNDYESLKNAYYVTHMLDPQWANYSEMRYLRFLLAQIYFNYVSDAPSDIKLEELTKELIQLLFDQFHDYMYHKLDSGGYKIVRRRNEGQSEDEYKRVYWIADYIEINHGQKITLGTIADLLFLNKAYVSSTIKTNIGVTFSELVSIARCSEAERQLASSDRTIDRIAIDVGFSNRGHLAAQFKKWYNVSPAQYRRQVLDDFKTGNVVKYHAFDKDSAEAIIRMYLNG